MIKLLAGAEPQGGLKPVLIVRRNPHADLCYSTSKRLETAITGHLWTPRSIRPIYGESCSYYNKDAPDWLEVYTNM